MKFDVYHNIYLMIQHVYFSYLLLIRYNMVYETDPGIKITRFQHYIHIHTQITE